MKDSNISNFEEEKHKSKQASKEETTLTQIANNKSVNNIKKGIHT